MGPIFGAALETVCLQGSCDAVGRFLPWEWPVQSGSGLSRVKPLDIKGFSHRCSACFIVYENTYFHTQWMPARKTHTKPSPGRATFAKRLLHSSDGNPMCAHLVDLATFIIFTMTMARE